VAPQNNSSPPFSSTFVSSAAFFSASTADISGEIEKKLVEKGADLTVSVLDGEW
jgi:hypothetical protein